MGAGVAFGADAGALCGADSTAVGRVEGIAGNFGQVTSFARGEVALRTNTAPGEFEFTFTPKSPGPYRAWFNLISLPMSLEEFPWQDLGSNAPAPKINRTPRAEANDGRSRVVLRWPAGPPRAGRKTVAAFQFTDDAGQPRKDLELIMGAFGHLVGFNEAFRTPLHVHPDPVPIGFETKNAGPELKFSLIPPKSGTWRLFLQTAHAGKTYTSDFTVEVLPQ